MWSRTRGLLAACLAIVATVGYPSGSHARLNDNTCPSEATCITSKNVSGKVDLTPRSNSFEDESNFTQKYKDGTLINDRVNSFRNRNVSSEYHLACFYANPVYSVFGSTVRDTHVGWFDNAAVDLSSMANAQSACPT